MYTMEELKTWWEVPAVAHFFSLFKSCFSLTDFTIEELEEALMVDGEDDKATTFTSRLLTELLQGCFDNPGISVTSYHDALISIMKTRWEGEDGRVNPLSSINADFHSLPTLLKVQIIHRLTEYRLDAKDVATKLAGLNPSDLRLEPLGADRNGSNYWYFFGVRLYKETPPSKKLKKRKHEIKLKKSNHKKAKYLDSDNSALNKFNSLSSHGSGENNFTGIFERFVASPFDGKRKKHKKKKQKKHIGEQDVECSVLHGLSDGKWEVVCYNVEDWKLLARKLEDSGSRREDALCQLIIDNFLPNLPKIVEDMEFQKLQKQYVEAPRRSSCRLLAKKLYEEEDGEITLLHENEKREENEEKRRNEENERLSLDFERMLKVELERARKDSQEKLEKEQEEARIKRLTDGIPLLEEEEHGWSSSDEEMVLPSDIVPPASTVPTSIKKDPELDGSVQSNKSKQSNEPNKSKRKGGAVKNKVENVNDAEKIGDFEYTAMWKAWESLDSNDDAWPFQNPVEEWYAPGYHNIIKRPMDLSAIEEKLKKTEYTKVSTFKDDIALMFNNCRLYNGPDSEYTEVANNLDKMFQKSLQTELSKKPSANPKTTSTNKPGRKQSNNAVKPPDKVVAPPTLSEPPPPPVVEEASGYLDDEEIDGEEENESESSSSDEFTPPGVSKAQMKKRKLELRKSKEQEKKKSKATTARRSSTRKSSSDVLERSEESDPEEEVVKVKAKIPSSTRGRKTAGRGRGNRASNNRRTTKDSESSEEEVPVKRVTKSRGRGGRRGRPAKGKGRGRRPSKAKTSESSSASGLEAEEVRSRFEDAADEKEEEEDRSATFKQESDIGDPVKSPKDAEKVEVKLESKKKSSARDCESSSSSSPASSRSHSLEKFEKLEEDAKSKPQVLWSLDYLASQARVLEEQHRRTESSASGKSTSTRRQSSESFSNRTNPKTSVKKQSDDDLTSFEKTSKRRSDVTETGRSRTNAGTREEDIYSFRDDDSLKSVKQNSVSPAASAVKSPATPSHNFYSPQSLTQNSKPASVSKAPDTKLRKSSVDPMSPPQTPSSGYSSSKSLSNSSNQYLSSSPYTDANKGAENKVGGKSGQRKSTPEPLELPFPTGFQTSKASAASFSAQNPAAPVPSSPQNQQLPNRPHSVSGELHGSLNQRSYSLPASSHNSSFPPSSKAGLEMAKSTAPTASTENRYHAPLQHSASIPYLNATAQQHAATDQQNPGHAANRRHSQPHIATSNMKTPEAPIAGGYHSKANSGAESLKNSDLSNSRLREKMPPGMQQLSGLSQGDMSTQRASQPQRGSNYPPQNHPQTSLPNTSPHNHPGRHNLQSRGYDMVQRSTDNYISPASSSQQQYVYGKPTQAPTNSAPAIADSRDGVQKYHHDGLSSQQQHQSRNISNSVQQPDQTMSSNYEPTMATFGLTPWSLSQPGPTGTDRGNQGNVEPGSSQIKSNSSTGYSTTKPSNNNNNVQQQQQQQAHSRLQQQQSYHSSSSAASNNVRKSQPPPPIPSPQQQQNHSAVPHQSSGGKARPPSSNPAAGNSPSVGGLSKQRQASTSSSQSNPPNPGMSGHSRRTSGNSSQPQYQKSHSHYGYHIPPTPAPTPGGEAQTAGYSPHQQNGLLSATNNNAALLHQDLTASATLRALQQQHKTDHPSHAAASMFHYAAAVQQSQGVAAASEKYNRLAAHHRATPQHGHPLAGVYHPHHQNAVTSTHQAAAHLSTPWLQAAAAAAPAAGYPGNLLSHAAHMDPVYQHLMQQSGMHGQYPMYPNHVMQQLHQQHLQHHMLPKY